jgi:AcrR family transcriptional regulator
MMTNGLRTRLINAATPLFARQGLSGVNVRTIARAAGVNVSLISYHFGGKEGLYAAVLREQFAGLRRVAAVAARDISATKKFASYLYECGICFHRGTDASECRLCLNNHTDFFATVKDAEEAP